MPLQKQTTIYSYSEKAGILEVNKGSFEDLQPSLDASSTSTSTSHSSWKLLRKLFKESKQTTKLKDECLENSSNKKVRRFSEQQHTHHVAEQQRNSPTVLRKLSAVTRQRKTSTNKQPTEQHLHPHLATEQQRNSPTGLRKLSAVTRQRKSSTHKQPTAKSRKFSAVNSQENLLHYFVTEADTSTLQKILQNKKVDINFMRPPGLSSLHVACVLGDLEVVEMLIQYGADINLRTWSDMSSLQIASLFGHFDVAQLLMRYGACCKDIQDGFSGDAKLLQTLLIYM